MQRGKMNTYRIIPVPKEDTVIDEKYYLEPDKDFYDAITAEKLLEGIEQDIKEMFKRRKSELQ